MSTCPSDKHGLHLWATGDSWGVIVGVSRCKNCDKLATTSDFERTRIVDEDGHERDVESQVII
jgi:hypothetical protein